MRSSTTPPSSRQHRVYCACPGPIRDRSLVRQLSTKAAAPGPRTVPVPRCETSKSPTAVRTAVSSAITPPPAYSIGIDQPLKSASLAPRATWRSCRGEVLTAGHASRIPRIDAVPPTITTTDRPLEKLSGDAVVVGVGKGPDGLLPTPGSEAVDRLLGGRLFGALADLGARGAEEEVTRLPTFGQGPFPVVVAVGLGGPSPDGGYSPDVVRRAAGAASRALSGRGSVVTLLAAVGGPRDAERLRAVGEGSLLGAYEFTEYKSDLPADRPTPPSSFEVVVPDVGAAKAPLKHIRAGADAVWLVRDLVNTPPNDLYPAELAARGAAAGEKAGLSVEVLDEKGLAAGGYGGILAVGGGSTRGPRLLRLTYKGKKGGRKIALVGKGITFDSGGLSIKPALNMENMKSDMAGAAAVIATVCLVAELELPVEVIATVPIAENLPSGTAYRPADVVTFRNGKKAEITNTDAEGSVVLADALARAAEDSPDALLETSTLTGAQQVALGNRTSGVMGTDELRDAVVAAGRRSGEAMWP